MAHVCYASLQEYNYIQSILANALQFLKHLFKDCYIALLDKQVNVHCVKTIKVVLLKKKIFEEKINMIKRVRDFVRRSSC